MEEMSRVQRELCYGDFGSDPLLKIGSRNFVMRKDIRILRILRAATYSVATTK
jgi:hypothetical protein